MKKILVGLMMISVIGISLSMFNVVRAFDPVQDVCNSSTTADSNVCKENTGKNPITGKEGIITKAVQILAILTGIAAVIVIIIGGFNFVTSGGDAQKVSTAKNTILYAVIGLIVAVLAQAIVILVLSKL